MKNGWWRVGVRSGADHEKPGDARDARCSVLVVVDGIAVMVPVRSGGPNWSIKVPFEAALSLGGMPPWLAIVVMIPIAQVPTNTASTSPLIARNPACGLSARRRAGDEGGGSAGAPGQSAASRASSATARR